MRHLLVFLSVLAVVSARAAGRPNIPFIFSDDHVQHATSAYGSKVNTTPDMDRIAKGGVQGVDDIVGRVLDCLDQAGLARTTIIIYSSDNGWYLGDLGLYDKRFMYEPGLRVPLLVRGPGIKAGQVPTQLVGNTDLAPTFLDLAGLPVPDSMQGRSLAPLLRGESPAGWPTTLYYRYYRSPGHHNTAAHLGVRTVTHKLIYYCGKNAYELFNLIRDPSEQHNLLHDEAEAKQPEIARLKALYKEDGQYAAADWPAGGVDGPFDQCQPTGRKTVAEAIAASAGK